MNETLWYVYENDYPMAVFDNRHEALKELKKMQIEEPDDEYELISIDTYNLDFDSIEYELAEVEGLI